MKIYTALAALLIICISSLAQNVGIGTNTPNSSAQLDISSTTKGMLLPRMTTTQRGNIPTPSKGLLVYDTDLNGLYHYNGSAWAAVGGSGGAGFLLPYSSSVANAFAAFDITNTGGGKAITGNSSGASLAAIEGTSTGAGGSGVTGSNNSATGFGVYGINTSTGAAVYGFSSTGGTALRGVSTTGYGLVSSGNLRLFGGNTNPTTGAVLTSVDASGNAVWKPTQRIAFKLYGVSPYFQMFGHGTTERVHFGYQAYDYGNDAEPTTSSFPTPGMSSFVAPVTGVYDFAVSMRISVPSNNLNHDFTSVTSVLWANRSGVLKQLYYYNANIENGVHISYTIRYNTQVRLVAGDIVYLDLTQKNDGSIAVDLIPYEYDTFFAGHLVLEE